jgi:hypothetical protein
VEWHAQAQIALLDAGIGVEAVIAKEEKIGSGVWVAVGMRGDAGSAEILEAPLWDLAMIGQ